MGIDDGRITARCSLANPNFDSIHTYITIIKINTGLQKEEIGPRMKAPHYMTIKKRERE